MDAREPYLPPPEPTDNPAPAPKKKATGWKTVGFWLLLIVMFVAIYQLFSEPSHAPRAVEPAPCSDGGGPATFLYGFLPGVALVAALVFWLWWQLRGGNRLHLLLEPGHLAFADGDMARAVEIYRAVEKTYAKQSAQLAIVRLSLASALERIGDRTAAIETFVHVERATWVVWAAEARLAACIQLGRLYALDGDLTTAARWLDDGQRRLARASHRTTQAAQLSLARAILLARKGDASSAARLLDEHTPRLEHALHASMMREAWAIRAFVAGADPRGAVGPWLTLARSGRPGALDHLGCGWPELRAFLVAHDLSAGARATSARPSPA